MDRNNLSEIFWFLSISSWCLGFVALPMDFLEIIKNGFNFIPLFIVCIPLTLIFYWLYLKFKNGGITKYEKSL